MTSQLATILARFAEEGTVIGLIGTLGAGKTHFVRGMAAALGVAAELVVSPTFVLCQQYDAKPDIYHYDAFRLTDADEFLALGADDILGRVGIALIEWSDRIAQVLPDDRLDIEFEDCGPTERLLKLTALGPRSAQLLDRVQSYWEEASTQRAADHANNSPRRDGHYA
jgi:tRNA threonylcarbamoyladenosine biosynthesis protein TsaE